MALLRFVTHPQVRISAEVPVPRWGLTDEGRARAEALARRPWVGQTARLLSSGETKALETAAVVAAATGLAIEVRDDLHENDRSSTGYLVASRFEQLADAFFAEPDRSVEGWETARHAQRRIVAATADLVAPPDGPGPQGDVLVVAHGAVGALLLGHLLGEPISRRHDQVGGEAAPGGGNVWAWDRVAQRVRHPWRALEVA